MQKLIIKQNNNNILFNPQIENIPIPDYKTIEGKAYTIAVNKINKIANKFNIEKKYINPIIKSMLHIYGYFYKHSKLINLIEQLKDKYILLVFSDFIEKNDIKDDNIKLIHLKRRYWYLILYRFWRHVITGFLFLSKKYKYDYKYYFKCESIYKYTLFKYYFPDISEKELLIIIDVPFHLPRVKPFIEFLNKNNIKYTKPMSLNIISFIFTISYIIKTIGKIKNYREYLIVYYLITSKYIENKYNKLISSNKNLKLFIASDEYNCTADIINEICLRNGIDFVNFQHAGIYLGDHNYQKFIVMGEWIKNYYCEVTDTDKNSIYVLGNPNLSKHIEYNKTQGKKLKILLTGQYIFGYVSLEIKEDILNAFSKLSCMSECECYYKEHPGAKDNLIEKYLNNSIKILNQQDTINYKDYDLILSFYSTTLIESVFNGVPSLSLNFNSIKGLYVLDNSSIKQVHSYKELENIIKQAIKDKNTLEELWNNEYKNMKSYWNINNNDKKRFDNWLNNLL